MGFRFRKSFKAGPIRVNLSKSGIGYSIGVKGARITKMANGRTRTTASIPGTGISYVSESKGNSSSNKSSTQTCSNIKEANQNNNFFVYVEDERAELISKRAKTTFGEKIFNIFKYLGISFAFFVSMVVIACVFPPVSPICAVLAFSVTPFFPIFFFKRKKKIKLMPYKKIVSFEEFVKKYQIHLVYSAFDLTTPLKVAYKNLLLNFNNSIFTPSEIANLEISYNMLTSLHAKGYVIKVGRGKYRLKTEFDFEKEYNNLLEEFMEYNEYAKATNDSIINRFYESN